MVGTLLIVAVVAGVHGSDLTVLKGDPFRGRELFGEKGCSRCHSVWGHGGTLGPDIVIAVVGKTWYELVGDFWNHTPSMIEEVSEQGYAWPNLDPRDMADTLSYLYYLRLFDEPGDPVRGADTYDRLLCSSCHKLGGRGGEGGGPLDSFGTYPSPANLAQAMWNSGPRMQKEQLRRGNPIPQFTSHEMADLQAYIRAEGLREGREIELQPLPDPTRGAEVFRRKECGACHDAPRGGVPDISRSALSRTVTEITGLLWNHSYAMSAGMAAQGVSFPRFEDTELSDLIAYLYFLGFVGEDGDPEKGAILFETKGCAVCHQGNMEGVPDLAETLDKTDRAGLAAAMWNHAPEMYSLMAETSPFWPKFEPGEMRNLAAYIRTHSTSTESEALEDK
jgi:cytochrome c